MTFFDVAVVILEGIAANIISSVIVKTPVYMRAFIITVTVFWCMMSMLFDMMLLLLGLIGLAVFFV